MPGVNPEKIPYDSIHHGETGARKYPKRPGAGNVQDGISLGGTETGDPKDHSPERGYGLTEPAAETSHGTRKSDEKDQGLKKNSHAKIRR